MTIPFHCGRGGASLGMVADMKATAIQKDDLGGTRGAALIR